MKSSIKTITPEMARKFLEMNTSNRSAKAKSIKFLADQMTQGKWKFTGDSIKISSTGRLLDGQHRLMALINANKTFDFVVINDLPDDVFDVIDTGKSRSSGDILSANSFVNSTNLAATIKFILNFKNGSFADAASRPKSSVTTNQDVLKFAKKHKDVEEIVSHCNSNVYRKFRYAPVSMISGLYCIFSERSVEDAEEFFDKYSTGVELQATSPIYVLREKLLRESTLKRKAPKRDMIAWFIMAWNAYRQDSPLKQITFNGQNAMPKPV